MPQNHLKQVDHDAKDWTYCSDNNTGLTKVPLTGYYKHWTRDPRTRDPKTRGPKDPRTGDPRTQILEGCVAL